MKPAIWFSRHAPTAAQIADAASLGFALLATSEGAALGSMDLRDDGDVRACATGLLAECAEHGAAAIFGVFAAPMLAQIARTGEDLRGRDVRDVWGKNPDIPCYAAWNISRAPEGGKPTFTHRSWVFIGRMSQDSCRWLR